MEITTATENGRVAVTIVSVSGNLDSTTFQVFQSRVEELINGGVRHILVDMTNAPYVSSAGLRAFQSIFYLLRDKTNDVSDDVLRKGISAGTYKSPNLKILNLSKEAETAFKTAGFDMFLETFTDRASAISAFG